MLKDRDIRQRTFGFISFSFLAHLGIIAASFLIPNVLKESAQGNKSETYLVESSTPATLGESAQALPAAPPTEAPAEIVTAPVDDATAIVVAKNELPAKKVLAPAREKAVAATKKVLSLPTKKAALPAKALPAKAKALPEKAAAQPQIVEQSEIEVNQALQASREAEESPEVAADIEVPTVSEERQDLSSDALEAAEEEAAQEAQAEIAAEEQNVETTEAVESATTTSTEESSDAAPALEQPLFAPINRGAQVTRPAGQGQVGGLGNNAAQAAPAPSTGAGNGAGNGAGSAAGAIRDADTLSEQPGNAKPTYAEDDQRAGRQGTVVFDAVVTREGAVQAIQMKQSSGHSSLDSSAYQAFKKHRYLPGQEGTVRKKFQFVLNGEQEVKSRLRRR